MADIARNVVGYLAIDARSRKDTAAIFPTIGDDAERRFEVQYS